jgi:hypothetical protein
MQNNCAVRAQLMQLAIFAWALIDVAIFGTIVFALVFA